MTALLDAEPAAAPVARARRRPRGAWQRFVPAIAMVGTAVALGAAYFPKFFDAAPSYDDEGAMLVTIQRFLDHGSLYNHTHGSYGPFFYSVAGAIFRIIGQSPTQFTGRLVVFVFTLLSVVMFGATVWKVTRSLTMSLLCEVATALVLVPFAGLQPMHPGSLIVLLLSVLGYCLAGWAMEQRTHYLVVVGIATGGLLMSKINVGLFAVAALMVAFVIGNRRFPAWFRVLVGIGAVVMPFFIVSQLLAQLLFAQFAVLVSFSVLAVLVPLHADEVTIPPRTLLVMGAAGVATIVASCIWPFFSGTPPKRLLFGVFIQPLGQVDHLTVAVHTQFEWLGVVLTLLGLGAVLARRGHRNALVVRPPWLLDAALATAGAFTLGLGLFGGTGAWLPTIVLLPALALLADQPHNVRLSLRFLVPLAIIQLLHVYPVAGSQTAWGMVVMCVPCSIAIAAGLRRLTVWRTTDAWTRVVATAAVCLLVVVGVSQWPGKIWDDYVNATPLNLRGARLLRLDAGTAGELQALTGVIRQHCDTFYSAPGYDILYVYTDLPTPTGQLANWPGVLNVREQTDVANQLRTLQQAGQRVCFVRNEHQWGQWKASSYGKGPLGKAVAPYQRRITRVGDWTVFRFGPPAHRHPAAKSRKKKKKG